MEHTKSGPPARRIALVNYSLVIVLAALLAIVSHNSGDAPGLVAIKTVMALFFLPCLRGVASYFKEPVVEARLTGRAVEYYVLNAAVISAFILLIVWKPELTAPQVLGQFAVGCAVFGAVNALALRRRINEARKSAGA